MDGGEKGRGRRRTERSFDDGNVVADNNCGDDCWKEIDELLSAIQRESFYSVGRIAVQKTTKEQNSGQQQQQQPSASSTSTKSSPTTTTAHPVPNGRKEEKQQQSSPLPSSSSSQLLMDIGTGKSNVNNDGNGSSSSPSVSIHTPPLNNTNYYSMFPSSSSFSLLKMPIAKNADSGGDNGTTPNGDDGDGDDAKMMMNNPPLERINQWLLKDVGIGGDRKQAAQIAQLLYANGFDRLEFMKGALNTAWMGEIGIERKMQLRICRHLNDRSQLHSCPEMVPNAATFEFVSDWLNALHLLDHLGAFALANLTSTGDLIAANLTRGDLEKMGIVRLGHLARIQRSLELANKSLLLSSSSSSFTSSHRSKHNKNDSLANRNANAIAAQQQQHNSHSHSLSASSTSPREVNSGSGSSRNSRMSGGGGAGAVGTSGANNSNGVVASSSGHSTSSGASSSRRAAAALASPPHMDMSGLRSRLVEACVRYTAHYLGSAEISNVEGTEDCRRAMAAAKAKAGQLSDAPHVIVEISVSGVNILDANQKAIFHQPINHIQVVCQDELDLNCFAYIFKDGNRHFSHVFCVLTAMIAKEIIVTLGEAFNLAFKLALQQQQEEQNAL